MEMTVSSTGFVNYFVSSERTARQIAAAYAEYGNDIIIINGDDDWFANDAYKVDVLLKKAKLEKIDDFHNGISGMSHSGAVIKKDDIDKFIKFVKKNYFKIWNKSKYNSNSRLSYYDKENERWVVLLKTDRKSEYSTPLWML